VLGLHARLKAAQHACGKHHHEPEHGLRRDGAQGRPSRLCVLAFQRRGEAKAVDGGKPEQRGKERRLEQKHPAIGGSDQPGHAAVENPALEAGGSSDGDDAKTWRALRSVQRFGGRLRRGIADQDQQRQQSAELGTAGKEVQSFRIDQQGRAMFHGEGMAMPGLKRKSSPTSPTAANRHRSGHAVRSTSAANTESAWAVRSWPKLVSSNTAGIAARASSAFAASDMSDVSSASHPSIAKSAATRLARTRRKQRASIASASRAPVQSLRCNETDE
jgi:hypothetical protein